LKDDKTVLYKTKSLDGTKPNTNLKTNPNPNTDSIQLFYGFFEHRPVIVKLAENDKGTRGHSLKLAKLKSTRDRCKHFFQIG